MWRRKRKPSADAQQAREQLAVAREELAAAVADDEPVDEVARKLRELRRKNHFGPMITEALRGSR